MHITIRRATVEDYPQFITIARSATTDFTLTEGDLLHADAIHDAQKLSKKFVALSADRQIVGTASVSQINPPDEPNRFSLWVYVRPELHGQGIGKRLYEHIVPYLENYLPYKIETGVCENLPRAMRFLHDRSFVETMREHESQLNLSSFDPARFGADLQHAVAEGITIQSLTQLAYDRQRDIKLRDLERYHAQAATGELPSAIPIDEWQARFWSLPRLLPDGFCIALDGERFIG